MLGPWKKSYGKPRQCIKKQRHHFVDKGPSSQSYGFSSNHVWMWELYYKESWVPKNWCFWTVVLERLFRVPGTSRRSNQSILTEISPSNEHPGRISFRMDWLDLLAVQGTLKSLLQHHSSKASVLLPSAFFIVQLSHPYMTTGKTIALTRRTFVGKVMSLLFNMLPRLVITFLPRSKCLLISWLQSPSAVILKPRKIVSHCFHCFPIYLPWSDGTRCHDLHFLKVEL